MTLPKTVECTYNGCYEKLWLTDGKYGKFYSHKAGEGYHNAKIKELFPELTNGGGESIPVAEYDAPVRRSAPKPATEGKPAVDWDEKDRKIQRQHSQEMALRWIAIKAQSTDMTTATLNEVRELTDWFMADLENQLTKERPAESVEIGDDLGF